MSVEYTSFNSEDISEKVAEPDLHPLEVRQSQFIATKTEQSRREDELESTIKQEVKSRGNLSELKQEALRLRGSESEGSQVESSVFSQEVKSGKSQCIIY